MREQHVSPDDDWNYVHNMMYAIANLMEQGKLAEANALSDHLSAARGQLSATLYIWSARDQMARISQRLPVALRVADWERFWRCSASRALKRRTRPKATRPPILRFLAAELSDYAHGMKALDNSDVSARKAASARMDAGLWRAQQDQADKDAAKDKDKKDAATKDQPKQDKPVMAAILPDAEQGPLMKCLGIASLELRAGVLVGQGKLDEAKKLYAQATAEEKKLGYHEPPFSLSGQSAKTRPRRCCAPRTTLGPKLLTRRRLKERPNSGFGLYGLARVAELQGDTAAARSSYSAFLKAWSAADAGLPELAHARSVVDGEAAGTR